MRYWRAALALAVLALLAGGIAVKAGLLAGKPPADLGVHLVDGQARLKPPSSTRNSVTSQANLYPAHPRRDYAQIAPLAYTGSGPAAMDKLRALLQTIDRTVVTQRQAAYLRAESSTRWLGFTDDVEFLLDEKSSVIHLRSASRLGREDFGANRQRVERIRALFNQAA